MNTSKYNKLRTTGLSLAILSILFYFIVPPFLLSSSAFTNSLSNFQVRVFASIVFGLIILCFIVGAILFFVASFQIEKSYGLGRKFNKLSIIGFSFSVLSLLIIWLTVFPDVTPVFISLALAKSALLTVLYDTLVLLLPLLFIIGMILSIISFFQIRKSYERGGVLNLISIICGSLSILILIPLIGMAIACRNGC